MGGGCDTLERNDRNYCRNTTRIIILIASFAINISQGVSGCIYPSTLRRSAFSPARKSPEPQGTTARGLNEITVSSQGRTNLRPQSNRTFGSISEGLECYSSWSHRALLLGTARYWRGKCACPSVSAPSPHRAITVQLFPQPSNYHRHNIIGHK